MFGPFPVSLRVYCDNTVSRPEQRFSEVIEMNVHDPMNTTWRNANKPAGLGKRNENGYALVGLMVVMMFALILATATAPTVRQETQREKEEEMLWRGQQVAFALKKYREYRSGAFPTDLKELIQGIDVNGKKIRLLRPSALCDPMTPCADGGNWRLAHPGDPLPKELLDAIIATQEKRQMSINPQSLQDLARFAQMGATKLPGQPSDTQLDGAIGARGGQADGNDAALGSDSDDPLKKKPIIGVVSKKSGKMYRSYYGIEEYDHVLFFPNVPVIVGGFVNPLVMTAAIVGGGGGNKDLTCPGGGVVIDGKCWGGIILGPIKRKETGSPQQTP
jgi:type II secretory pathway pseudopilin PulG